MLRSIAAVGLLFAVSGASAIDAGEVEARTLDEVEARTHHDYDVRLARYVETHRLVTDVAPKRALDLVFVRLLAVAFERYPDARRLRWELKLVQDNEINAECYSDGRILLSRTFVQRYANDANQLAFVLGHEIGHALAGHVRGYYLVAATKIKAVGLTSELLFSNVESDYALRFSLSGLAREQEFEADRIGVMLATRAGFARRGAEAVLRDFMQMADGGRAGWTHASAAVRLEEVRRMRR